MEGTAESQDPLDRLPLQINVVLTQIGRIFQHAAKGNDVKNMGRSRTQMHETIARANRQFHEALDDVEIQILDSKSVLERDLEALRAKRRERERALRAEAEPAPAISTAGKTPPEAEAPAEPASAASNPDEFGDDIVMIDSAMDFLENGGAAAHTPPKDQPAPQTSSPPAPSTSGAPALDPPTLAGGAPTDAPAFPDTLSDSFVAVPGGDDDFDSMFDDAGGALEFAGGAAGADGGAADASEDIDSLMPGLDSMVGAAANGGVAAAGPPAGTVALPGLTVAPGGVAPVAPMSRGNSDGGTRGEEREPKEAPKLVGGGDAEGAATTAAQDGTGTEVGGLDGSMDDLFFGDGMGDFEAGDGEIGNLDDLDSWLA